MTEIMTILAVIVAGVLTAGMILIIFEMIVFVFVMCGYAIQDKITEIKCRPEMRFLWYYRMGLCESSWLLEPKVAKSYCWKFTPWSK